MSFLNSLVLLAAVIAAVLVPMFLGHGLVTGNTTAILGGVGMLVVSGVLVFLLVTRMEAGGEGGG